MKIYKVYALGEITSTPIEEISEAIAHQHIRDQVDVILDFCPNLFPNIYGSAFDDLCDKAITAFDKYGFFNFGNFQIVKSDEYPTRSGFYGFPKLSIFFE